MGEIAFVFAGQGAQFAGMGKDVYERSPAARALLDRFESIRPGTLRQCFEPVGDEQNITVNTQPCVFAVDCACAVAAVEAGLTPSRAAGFSLGELAAAAFSGMMDYERAFRLVIRRAELMQAAAETHPGGMFAVLKKSADEVREFCLRFESGVYPANYNAPGQTVVACEEKRIDEFLTRAAEAGIKAMRLNVSGCFHSPFMLSASRALYELLASEPLKPPRIPVYANKTALPYASELEKTLSDQVSSPVLWQSSVENMIRDGVSTFIEVGAGKTLTGLIKRIDQSVDATCFGVRE